jgi:hypothetical protein
MTSPRSEHFCHSPRGRRLAISAPTLAAVGLLLIGWTGSPAAAQDPQAPQAPRTPPGTTLYPTDAARTDPDLARLRDALLEACRKRDTSLLARELADEVYIYGDSYVGRKNVLQRLKELMADDPETFWRDLEGALTLGIVIEGDGEALAPYAFRGVWCDHDFCAVITGSGVRVRAAPSSSAPIVDLLAYNVVPYHAEENLDMRPERIGRYRYGWLPVTTPSGKRGFISEKYAHADPGGPAFFFRKHGNRWRLWGLYAGC